MVKGINGYALLVSRLILGFIFVMHGWQKLRVTGIGQVTRDFDAMGIPYPEYAAQFSTWVELLGGLALIVGLVLPIICLLLIVDIAGAIYFSHLDAGFWNSEGGFEYPLALIAGLLAITFAQGSKFSAGTMMYTKVKKKLNG